MDSVRQATDLLSPRLQPGMTLLDVGSAAGHLRQSLEALGVEYHGIDPNELLIEIGRAYAAREGQPRARLRALDVEHLPVHETYDAVVSLSTLQFMPAFQQPLEAMARAARRWLVVRASFGDRTETRFVPDVLLEPGFETMRAYFNVYARDEVTAFLASEGFSVAWEPDRRQRDRFSGRPEAVGGIEIPYEFLVAERVSPPPGRDEILGDGLTAVADEWRRSRSA
jgi:hypothetical protein